MLNSITAAGLQKLGYFASNHSLSLSLGLVFVIDEQLFFAFFIPPDRFDADKMMIKIHLYSQLAV